MLMRHQGAWRITDALADGINSAAIIWHDWASDVPELDAWVHRPARNGVSPVNWHRPGTGQSNGAMMREYSERKRQRRLDELFSYSESQEQQSPRRRIMVPALK
jgi:hypothetical protein